MRKTLPYAAVEASYRWLDYRQAYAGVLERHPDPSACLLELLLFRVWLAQHAWDRLRPRAGPDSGPATAGGATPLPPDWLLPAQIEGVDIATAGGATPAALLRSRFRLYDRAVASGRGARDPHGLDAAAWALACQLFHLPSGAILALLARRARGQYAGIAQACAAAASRGG